MEACKCVAGSSWLSSFALCQGSWTFEKRWTELGCSRQGSTGLLFNDLYITIIYYYITIILYYHNYHIIISLYIYIYLYITVTMLLYSVKKIQAPLSGARCC